MYNKIINILKEEINQTDTLYWVLGICEYVCYIFLWMV